MFASLRFHNPKTAATVAAIFVHLACGLSAQNFTSNSASLNPFGVNGPLPFGEIPDFGGDLGLKGGFAYGIGVSSAYNSNVLLSEDDPEDDVFLSVSPTVGYTSDPEGGAKMVILANYSPSANASLNNSDFSSFDQRAGVSMIVSGARTTLSAFGGISQDSGADSLAASRGFFTGTSVSLGLQGTYQLAPRTSVSAGWSSSIVDYGESAGNSGTGNDSSVRLNGYSVYVGGSWAATERLSFGPRLGYSTSDSDTTEDFSTWDFSMVGRYKLSERIQVAGSLGIQYSDYSRDGESQGLSPSGSLSANYQINELWSWRSSVQSSITPSPTSGSYVINGWSISSVLDRELLVGSAGIGLNMGFSNFDRTRPTGSFSETQEDQQNFGFLLNYSRPLFTDRLEFSSSLVYRLNNGDSEWSQLQLAAGLNLSF